MQNPFRHIVAVLAATGIATGIGACAAASYKPAASGQTKPPSAASAKATGQGTGPMSIHDGSTASGSGPRSVTTKFSLDFAKCMRAHGVPDFPDPDASAGQFGPGSGIDPGSAAFQAAVNGPCQSLAPPAWAASGQVGASS